MPTPTENYWNSFSVTDADLERLYGFVLDRGEPVSARDLVRPIVDARVREEEERRARLTARVTIYQPKLEFEIGQRLIFPEMSDVEGTVTAIRDGDNPRLPPFKVISVHFDHDGRTREFAGSYDAPHPLNAEPEVATGAADLSPDEILDQFGDRIERVLVARLRSDREFVEQDGRWLLRGLLAGVHEGHLNIAEAAIEQNNSALSTPELARVLELGTDGVKPNALAFSLEYALRHDDRFINVGPRGEPRWYLARLEPAEARSLPRILQLPTTVTDVALSPDLEALVRELEDEADIDRGLPEPSPNRVPVVTLILTYPHRRIGTLPLTTSVRALFPETGNRNLLVSLVDDASGARIPAWLVEEGSYLFGLKPWYDQRKLNPGAFIQLERRPEPLTATISYQPQRERSLWVRGARVQGGRLTFGQERRPLAHKYDEDMLIIISDPAGIDRLHESSTTERPLEMLLAEVFPELAKLSSAGRVHAKTLYSAVNFMRRVGPRAVFIALSDSDMFQAAGGGYFVLDTLRAVVR